MERDSNLPKGASNLLLYEQRLSCFGDFSGFDAVSANAHALVAALRSLNADGLKVGVETAFCAIVSVRDVVAKLWAFATYFTAFCHNCLTTSRVASTEVRSTRLL